MMQKIILLALEVTAWGSDLVLLWCMLLRRVRVDGLSIASIIVFALVGFIMTATLSPSKGSVK